MTPSSYYYLATEYTKYKEGLEEAYKFACKQTAILAKSGVSVISPIAHSHGVAIHGEIDPVDHETWMVFDKPMLENCYGVIVVTSEGWKTSRGIEHELQWALKNNKPVVYMQPNTVPESLKHAVHT
jgi:hypothetical protein